VQDKQIEIFSEEDNQMVDRLKLLGMSRKAAKVFTYLIQRNGTALDIERITAMRQPEVSVGLKELSVWVRITPGVKVKPHARPVSIYSLDVPWADVVRHYYRGACENYDQVTAAYGALVSCLDLSSQNRLDQK
jgi:predicted transcriptional regulator